MNGNYIYKDKPTNLLESIKSTVILIVGITLLIPTLFIALIVQYFRIQKEKKMRGGEK